MSALEPVRLVDESVQGSQSTPLMTYDFKNYKPGPQVGALPEHAVVICWFTHNLLCRKLQHFTCLNPTRTRVAHGMLAGFHICMHSIGICVSNTFEGTICTCMGNSNLACQHHHDPSVVFLVTNDLFSVRFLLCIQIFNSPQSTMHHHHPPL